MPPTKRARFRRKLMRASNKRQSKKQRDNAVKRKKSLKNVDITLPSTLSEELETNPFLRSKTLSQFKELRIRKDNF